MASTNGFDFPSNSQMTDANRMMTIPWGQWLNRIQDICNSVQQSGATADRPTSVLWVGRFYFDTDLGKPVYVKSVRPTVWCDAVGTFPV